MKTVLHHKRYLRALINFLTLRFDLEVCMYIDRILFSTPSFCVREMAKSSLVSINLLILFDKSHDYCITACTNRVITELFHRCGNI